MEEQAWAEAMERHAREKKLRPLKVEDHCKWILDSKGLSGDQISQAHWKLFRLAVDAPFEWLYPQIVPEGAVRSPVTDLEYFQSDIREMISMRENRPTRGVDALLDVCERSSSIAGKCITNDRSFGTDGTGSRVSTVASGLLGMPFSAPYRLAIAELVSLGLWQAGIIWLDRVRTAYESFSRSTFGVSSQFLKVDPMDQSLRTLEEALFAFNINVVTAVNSLKGNLRSDDLENDSLGWELKAIAILTAKPSAKLKDIAEACEVKDYQLLRSKLFRPVWDQISERSRTRDE